MNEAAVRQLELLGSAPFARLWERVRRALERSGRVLGESSIVLASPGDDERRAISGLLGRSRSSTRSLKLRLADLDRALRAGPTGLGLVEVAERLGGPLRDRVAEANRAESAAREALQTARGSKLAGTPWFTEWLERLSRDGTLTRLVGADEAQLIPIAAHVLERLPADGITLAVLAGEVARDTKALDGGTLATLVTRALATQARRPKPKRAEERRELWEAFGVVVDDLASQVLVLNLPVRPSSPLGEWLLAAARDGTPVRITLQQLTRYSLDFQPTTVWSCENPAVLRTAALRLGQVSPPLICSEGQPSVAYMRLLRQLDSSGCRLAHHADFDWSGVQMTDRLIAQGARPWRMSTGALGEALKDVNLQALKLLKGRPEPTPWDPALEALMVSNGRVVYEEMVVESLLNDLTTSESCDALPVALLPKLVRCAHRVRLDEQRVPSRSEALPLLDLLWTDRADREREVADGLGAALVQLPLPVEQRREQTRELMRAGAAWIAGPELESPEWQGGPSLLERVPGSSSFGDFHYVPVLVRAASATDDAEQVKLAYAVELCAHADALAWVQGRRPLVGRIVDRDDRTTTVKLQPFRGRATSLRERLMRVVLGQETTRAGRKQACDLCRWETDCEAELASRDDLSLVAGVGEGGRELLEAAGIATSVQLAEASADRMLAVRGIGSRRAETWRRQAHAQVRGQAQVLQPWIAPAAAVTLVYDVEDDPLRSFVYLHGLLKRQEASEPGTYLSACATAGTSEEDVWRAFLAIVRDVVRETTDFVVYVYSRHERSTVERLRRRYGGSPELDCFTERFVDVLEEIRRTVVLPLSSLSLKAVARWIGFEWRDSEADGAASMAWWRDYERDSEGNAAARERILRYNEDDVRATLVVVDWMARLPHQPSTAIMTGDA
ncbi:MAG: TIGR02679 family protein [Planctomycetes bacterium]|nr:TIGR02679 family protein [Planctomycetota bacterium]